MEALRLKWHIYTLLFICTNVSCDIVQKLYTSNKSGSGIHLLICVKELSSLAIRTGRLEPITNVCEQLTDTQFLEGKINDTSIYIEQVQGIVQKMPNVLVSGATGYKTKVPIWFGLGRTICVYITPVTGWNVIYIILEADISTYVLEAQIRNDLQVIRLLDKEADVYSTPTLSDTNLPFPLTSEVSAEVCIKVTHSKYQLCVDDVQVVEFLQNLAPPSVKNFILQASIPGLILNKIHFYSDNNNQMQTTMAPTTTTATTTTTTTSTTLTTTYTGEEDD